MSRIPEETIERLKQEVSLERLAEARGVKLERHGADLRGLCPFHDDREPSLVITPAKNLWHCLGACQAGGTAIDWVMKAEGVSFRHAVELLRDGVPVEGKAAPVKQATVRKLAAPVRADAGDAEILSQVAGYYHETLKQSPEALGYLLKRGLGHPEMVERFRLGFANRTLGLRLPQANRAAGEEIRGRLQRLGILRESGHEHFNGSVVIPVISPEGAVLGMYGRKITENLRPGTPLHMYMPGEHRGVWNEEALQASKEIILCESLVDALTFWCAGFRNVTASYGVNGFTDDHRAALRKHGVESVLIAYDRDEAGDKAAEGLGAELMAMGIECRRVLFPKGMDANEYALKVTPAEKSLGVLLNTAGWMGKGKRPEAAGKPAEEAAKEETVLPLAAAAAAIVEGNSDELVVTFEERRYRVRGIARNPGPGVMKVNLMAACCGQSGESGFHIDAVNLEMARDRAAFARLAAVEMGVREDIVRRDLGRVLLLCEQRQDEQAKKPVEPKRVEVKVDGAAREEALALLKDPRLVERIVEDFGRCGVVGEETNKLIGYLAAVSRRLETPLAVVVQSSSAAGKSSLTDAVLRFVPKEERVQFSAMTGQSLYYMGESDLKHKVLAIAEQEGASRAAYALKLLQSEGEVSIASTGKDPATGRLVTHEYRVEGPVAIFLTTTAIEIDEELLNRCLVLAVDEEREQTRAIHKAQREQQTLEGLVRRREAAALTELHQNAQRLLEPVAVVNPYAGELTFPDSLPRMRRDHMKYLTLIQTIALLHQYRRPKRTERGVTYIEAAREDIALADRLMKELMRRSLDELPPQTRRLLGLVRAMVTEEGRRLGLADSDYRFTRREVRAWTRWGHTQLKVHLGRLEELEYLIPYQGGRGRTYVYELNWSGLEEEKAGDGRPVGGGMSGGGRGAPEPMNTGLPNGFAAIPGKRTVPARGSVVEREASYA
jgi:DNA primase